MHVSLGFMVYNNHPCPQAPPSESGGYWRMSCIIHYMCTFLSFKPLLQLRFKTLQQLWTHTHLPSFWTGTPHMITSLQLVILSSNMIFVSSLRRKIGTVKQPSLHQPQALLLEETWVLNHCWNTALKWGLEMNTLEECGKQWWNVLVRSIGYLSQLWSHFK